MLIFKGLPGTADSYVRIGIYDCKTRAVLGTANIWSGLNQKDVTINAVDNGIHGPNTLHGLSLAWDLGVVGSLKSDFKSLSNYLKMRLPPPYQVIVESDHIHIEWDTGKGR